MAKKKTTRRAAPRKAASKKTARKAAAKPAKKASRKSAAPAPAEPPTPVAPPESPARAHNREVAIAVARALDEANCSDIVVLDLLGLSQVWDFLIVGSGTSERQMRTAIDRAEEAARPFGEKPFGGFRDRSPTWMALDFIDVAVHVFEPTTRGTYDLELLWGDAPRVDWSSGAARRSAAARPAKGP